MESSFIERPHFTNGPIRNIQQHQHLMKSTPSPNRESIATQNNENIVNTASKLNILSFNCKNIKTSGPFFQEVSKKADIVLIQEHWLYHYELNLLDEIHENYKGIGKSVDSECLSVNPNNRRGYGGVAVLWSKEIDRYIKSKTEGGVRVQCVEIDISEPILIVSVYLPTKADNDRYDEYSDCLDQLYEIIQI